MNRTVFAKALLLTAILAQTFPAQAEEEVFRLGIIGLDTSHVIAFTQIINNPKNNISILGCFLNILAFPFIGSRIDYVT